MTKPNEVGMECARMYGSLLCVRVKTPREEIDSDYVGCGPSRKSTMCWTQGVRSLGDDLSELRAAADVAGRKEHDD